MTGKSASDLSDRYPAGLHAFDIPRRHSPKSNEAHRESRSVSVDVRLTVAERESVRDRARLLDVKPSAWGRTVMLDALGATTGQVARLQKTALAVPQPELAAAVEQLRRAGVNLNQALRNGSTVDDTLLREVLLAVNSVRASLGDRTRA